MGLPGLLDVAGESYGQTEPVVVDPVLLLFCLAGGDQPHAELMCRPQEKARKANSH